MSEGHYEFYLGFDGFEIHGNAAPIMKFSGVTYEEFLIDRNSINEIVRDSEIQIPMPEAFAFNGCSLPRLKVTCEIEFPNPNCREEVPK